MKNTPYHSSGLYPFISTLSAAALMLGACTPLTKNEAPNTGDVNIQIPFDSKGCPQQPLPIDTDKGKRIVWQSIDTTTKMATKERYEIFFDPFVGRPQRSDRNGELKSLPFSRKVPPTIGPGKIEYKYTIVGDRCKDQPMDPRLWLRR